MEVGGQRHAPATFTPEQETRYPLYRRLGGPQNRTGWVRKTSPLTGFVLRTVHPVASRCTNWAIAAHVYVIFSEYNLEYSHHYIFFKIFELGYFKHKIFGAFMFCIYTNVNMSGMID